MKIGVLTLFPAMFDAIHYGVTGRALENELLQVIFRQPRDFTDDPTRRVDDRPYGGGPGMVMQFAPLHAALVDLQREMGSAHAVYLSPQGRPLTQARLKEWSCLESLILVSGRYEGIDERFIERAIDEECSLGDYVLSGGEIAAMAIIDGIARLLPGALGHPGSAEADSFAGGLLDYPHYTRPEILDEQYSGKVPTVLLSGDHQAIARWRAKQALGRTYLRRRDLVERLSLTAEQQQLLTEFLSELEKKHE